MNRFTDLKMTIGGEPAAGRERLDVLNPASGEVFASCPDATREELDRAMVAAQAAIVAWRRDEGTRRTALKACADAIMANEGALTELLTREQGKTLKEAAGEVRGAAHWFNVTAGLALPVDIVADDARTRVEVRRRPLGVVAAITPWNFPFILAAWKIAPALLAGNTVVLKPSPHTPLSTLALGQVLAPELPPGVLNVVSGGNELGAWMTQHPAVAKIAFTGSVRTGKAIAAAAAPDLKRVTLELGGNDPAIVLDDVAPEKIARSLFWGAFANSGQVCVAIKRLYVHEAVYQPVVDALTAYAAGIKVGDGLDPESDLGPVNNAPQLAHVEALVEDALSRGAKALTGGKRLEGGGYFFPPTVVEGVEEGARLVDEEQFGPALPVMRFSRLDEVFERANATHFGLGASIWTAQPERGAELAGEIDSGTVWINQHRAFHPLAPFGGMKWSGVGYENGHWGLSAYTQLQAVHVRK